MGQQGAAIIFVNEPAWEAEGDMTRLHISRREPLLSELESFIEVVRTGGVPVVSGHDGLQALRLAEQVVEQGRERVSVESSVRTSWN